MFAGGQSWISPRGPNKAAANDPHFLCTDRQLIWVIFLAGRDHASIFKQRFNDVPGI